MDYIRKASMKDSSRLAEILIFTKRMNFVQNLFVLEKNISEKLNKKLVGHYRYYGMDLLTC